MNEPWYEGSVCFICNYWWVLLLILALGVGGLIAMNNMGIAFPWARTTSVAVAGVTETPRITSTPPPATTAPSDNPSSTPTTVPPASPSPAPTTTRMPAVTATPSPVSGPDVSCEELGTVYEDFNNPDFENSVDASKWPQRNRDPNILMAQQNGELVVNVTPAQARLNGSLSTLPFSITWPAYIEARIKANEDNVGEHMRTAIQFIASNYNWWAKCGLSVDEWGPRVDCGSGGASGDEFYRDLPAQYNKWYTVRVLIDPETFTISFFVDGELLGSYVPTDADRLKETISFRWEIHTWAEIDSGGTMRVDDATFLPGSDRCFLPVWGED